MGKRALGLTASLLAFLLIGGLPMQAHAQDLTIGYTNDRALLVNMPEYQDVQQQLQQATQERQQELQQMQQELQNEMEEYQQQQGMLSEEARTNRQQEIRQLRTELRQAAMQGDRELRQQRQELMQPLFEELQTAIEAVAQERGISLVIREQALLYTDGSDNVVNITSAVAEQLGIELQQASPTGAN